MGIIKLTRAEKRLVRNIEHGDKTDFTKKRQTISAEVLRHITLGLPLFRKGVSPLAPKVACVTTGAGVSIRNALISGPVKLDAAIGCLGGPLCPLEFHDCTFDGWISGANAHFSRLSFRNCASVDDGTDIDPDTKGPIPTVRLCGARLDAPLDMGGAHPAARDGLLWIDAAGIHVGGGIDLSGCTLRAPSPLIGPGVWDRAEDALDLTMAEIDGDLMLRKGSRIAGRLKLRGTRIRGDLWLNGAKMCNPGEEETLFLQGASIGGFLVMDAEGRRAFICVGNIDLTAVDVGRSFIFKKAVVRGGIKGPDLTVRDDFYLNARIEGRVGLEHVTIGGSLDLSDLRIRGLKMLPPDSEPEAALFLKDSSIGGELRLAPARPAQPGRFRLDGTANLMGLTCEMLDDEIGQRWGKAATIEMNHFVYNRMGWLHGGPAGKPSHRMLGDWLLAKWAEGHGPLAWLPNWSRLQRDDYWAPWQLRRNWIYQRFAPAKRDPVSIARHRISEQDYRPQPLEQAIRVARAEGRDDFATHFEMLKQRIEWGYFNRLVRWWLGFAGILLGSVWLVLHQRPADGPAFNWGLLGGTLIALAASMLLMVGATKVHSAVSWVVRKVLGWLVGPKPEALNVALTWAVFFFPVYLLLVHSSWKEFPFHFLIALLIFILIRFIAVFAHAVMRFGFGYLQRPVRAIVTLILAFLLGWLGVHAANRNDMFVVTAEPVATLVAPHDHAPAPQNATGDQLMGSENAAGETRFVRDISCRPEISEPLYALDVLVPLVDLHEESRCEIRRIAADRRPAQVPGDMNWATLRNSIYDITAGNHPFWWAMKALYAIAGWFIVSLSILTFAHANRAHAEPPTEHK